MPASVPTSILRVSHPRKGFITPKVVMESLQGDSNHTISQGFGPPAPRSG